MSEPQDISLNELEGKFNDLNEKLKVCHEFSSRGFHEHAIYLAEENDRGLLEECSYLTSLVDQLRSSGADEFVEELEKSSLAAVDEPYYQSLQSVYERVESTKALRTELKKLVLQRAPAPCRLGVMREWLSLDPTHPTLESDIRELEKFWLRQVVPYCNRLAKISRTDDIVEVRNDLAESGYVEEVPNKVVEQIDLAIRKSRLNRLPILERKIKKVHADQVRRFPDKPADVPFAETKALDGLFVELDKLFKATKTEDRDLVERLKKSLRWNLDCIAAEKLRNDIASARTRLSKLIQDRYSNPEDIQAAITKAVSLDAIDEIELAEATAAKEKREKLSRFNWRVAALACFILAVAIPITYFSISSLLSHRAAVAAVVKRVDGARKKSSTLNDALQAIADSSEDVQSDERIVELRRKVTEEIELFQQLHGITKKIGDLWVPKKLSEIVNKEKQVDSINEKLSGRRSSEGELLFLELEQTVKDFYGKTGEGGLRADQKKCFDKEKSNSLKTIEELTEELRSLKISVAFDPDITNERFVENKQKLERILERGLEYDTRPQGVGEKDTNYYDPLTNRLKSSSIYKDGYLIAEAELNDLLSKRKEFTELVTLLAQGPVGKTELNRLFEKRNQITALPAVDERVVDEYLKVIDYGKAWRDAKFSGKSVPRIAHGISRGVASEIERIREQVVRATDANSIVDLLEQMAKRPEISKLWKARDPTGGPRGHKGYFVFEESGEPGAGPHKNIGNSTVKVAFPKASKSDKVEQPSVTYPQKAVHQKFSQYLLEQVKAHRNESHLVVKNAYEWLRTDEQAVNIMPPEARCQLIRELIQLGSKNSVGLQQFFENSEFAELKLAGDKCPEYTWATDNWSNRYVTRKIEAALKKLPEFSTQRAIVLAEEDRTAASQNWVVKIVGVYRSKVKRGEDSVDFFQASSNPMQLIVLDPEDKNLAYTVERLASWSDTRKQKFNLMPVIALPAVR